MRPLRIPSKNPRLSVARRTVYNGRTYHSALEARYAARLDQLMAARGADRVKAWVPQRVVSFVVNGRWICDWTCDFYVEFEDGHIEYHEVKGVETEGWIIRRRLFEAVYPDRILKVIREV